MGRCLEGKGLLDIGLSWEGSRGKGLLDIGLSGEGSRGKGTT